MVRRDLRLTLTNGTEETRKLANQERHEAGLRAPSSDPGIPKAGSALPARGGRAPPGPGSLLSNSCGAPAGPEPEYSGRRTGRHCLQRPYHALLRIGGGRGGDLYTFHPPSGTGCTYRLGCRADLCDVALRPQQEPGFISGVHAELHAERQGDDWRVSLEDHSSQGTSVNNVRLPKGHRLELSDGDLLTFGPEKPPGTGPSEFYFMFQQVRVKPQDFAAITIPRSRIEEGTGFGFQPMLPPRGAPQRPLSTLSPAPKATLILNSIGSLSKLQPQPLTFSRSGGGPPNLPPHTPHGKEGTIPSAPTPRNRRKSAHRVLAELDDEREAPESPLVLREPRKKLCVEKTPLTPSGNHHGHPPKHPVSTPMTPPVVGGGEPCAAPCCCLPQEETVAWVQCDGCDLWFHVACAGCSIQAAREADFRCPGCHMGIQT